VVQIISVSLSGQVPGDNCENVQFVNRMMLRRRPAAQPGDHDFSLMIFMNRRWRLGVEHGSLAFYHGGVVFLPICPV